MYNPACNACAAPLVVGTNWTAGKQAQRRYRCNACDAAVTRGRRAAAQAGSIVGGNPAEAPHGRVTRGSPSYAGPLEACPDPSSPVLPPKALPPMRGSQPAVTIREGSTTNGSTATGSTAGPELGGYRVQMRRHSFDLERQLSGRGWVTVGYWRTLGALRRYIARKRLPAALLDGLPEYLPNSPAGRQAAA